MNIGNENKRYSFPLEEIEYRALYIYILVNAGAWGSRGFLKPSLYDEAMKPLSKRFKEAARAARKDGEIESSKTFEDFSKKFAKGIGIKKQDQIIVFLVWLTCQEFIKLAKDEEDASRLSLGLKKILLNKNGLDLLYNHWLSEERCKIRKDTLEEYDRLGTKEIFGPQGAYEHFVKKLAEAIVLGENDEDINSLPERLHKISDVSIISLTLSSWNPLKIYVLGVKNAATIGLDIDLSEVKRFIEKKSKTYKVDLTTIYGIPR